MTVPGCWNAGLAVTWSSNIKQRFSMDGVMSFLMDRGASFRVWLRTMKCLGVDTDHADHDAEHIRRPIYRLTAQSYLDRLGAGVEDLFHHAVAVLHDPAYREDRRVAGGPWPLDGVAATIPLPGWPDGDKEGAAEELATSASARGRELAALLDSDKPVPGVTEGTLRPEIAAIAVPSTVDGGNMTGNDFALTAGWGHLGRELASHFGPMLRVVGPLSGRPEGRPCRQCRPYTTDERTALGEAIQTLGDTTFDVYRAERLWAFYWRCGFQHGRPQVLDIHGWAAYTTVPRACCVNWESHRWASAGFCWPTGGGLDELRGGPGKSTARV